MQHQNDMTLGRQSFALMTLFLRAKDLCEATRLLLGVGNWFGAEPLKTRPSELHWESACLVELSCATVVSRYAIFLLLSVDVRKPE